MTTKSFHPQIEYLESRAVPTIFTWTGLGQNNLWSNGDNWDQNGAAPTQFGADDLVFPDASRQKNNVCDLVSPSFVAYFNSITFTGSGFTLNAGPNVFGLDVQTIMAENHSGINTINIETDSPSSITSLNAGTTLSFSQRVVSLFDFGFSIDGAGDTYISVLEGHFHSLLPEVMKRGAGKLSVASGTDFQMVLDDGTLAVTNNSLQRSALVLNGGAIKAWNGPVTLACPVALDGDVTFAGNQPLLFTGVATLSGDRTLDVENTTEFGFTIFGPPSLSLVDNGLGFGITKDGPGTLILAGLGQYSGATTLDQGTLVVDFASSLGSGALFLDGGTIEGGYTGLAIANPVVLGGDFSIGGAGILDFTGPISLTGNRAITVASSAVGIFDGSVAEDIPGRMLILDGAGVLDLNSANSYSGGTLLFSGTLGVADNGALGSGPINLYGGTLSTADALNFSNPVFLNGSVTMSGFSLFGSPQYTFSGLVTLTGNSTLKVVIPTIISGSITEDQAGRNLIKAGNAKLTITTGAFPGYGYTGTTTVQAGTLQVDGYLGDSDVIVQRRGLLEGTGTVGSVTLQGTLKPGDSPGVLTIAGDLNCQSGSTLRIVLDPSGPDQIDVQGACNAKGAAVQVIEDAGVVAGAVDAILQVNGTLGGIIGALANDMVFYSGGGRYRISYETIATPDGVSRVVDLTVLAIPTTIAVTSSATSSMYGELVTLTATVTVPAGAGYPIGSVTFADETPQGEKVLGLAALVRGKAVFQTSTLSVGSHAIQVHYDGSVSPPYMPAVEGSRSRLIQLVRKAATATMLTASLNPSIFGQTVTFTARVAPILPPFGIPTGTVTFKDGSTILGTVDLQVLLGQAVASFTTSTLSVGAHHIKAVYDGDLDFRTSVSAILTQTVLRPPT